LLEGLAVAIAIGGLIASAGYEYTGPWPFLRRWATAVILITGLFWGGAAFGAVARNAMCQGFWICD
jgi:hypothetical protein